MIEYVGEIIDTQECQRRLDEQEKAGTASFYILSIASDLYIDARVKANAARFINHSCDPNCDTQVGRFQCLNSASLADACFPY